MICLLLLVIPIAVQAQASNEWGILPATEKITPAHNIPADVPALHAARGEYAPFQVILRGGIDGVSAPQIAYDETAFTIERYEQHFFPIRDVDEAPAVFSMAWIEADFIADGLRGMGDVLLQGADGVYAAWVDVYVLPDAAPGDYTLTVTVGDESRDVPLTVYPVDLTASGAMSVMIPLSVDWTVPTFASERGMSPVDYQMAVNALLVAHHITPGSLVGTPTFDGARWDFSSYTDAINAIPVGNAFYAPLPYNEAEGVFYITDESGEPYTSASFDDPVFVAALEQFFADVRVYLDAIGRVDDAMFYPIDETFWVADEPDNNGPAGYERLQRWAEIINAAGLRVTGSRVLPVPFVPGWADVTNLVQDTHVPTDYLDAAPDLFAAWRRQPGNSTSVYLNQYGDIINLSPAVNRGIVWYAYARDVRTITGYAALEWLDESFSLVNPFREADAVYPHFGYGTGALIYPDPAPSVRLKLLREGVEDARLLDLYAAQTSLADAQAFAACLSPGDLAYQNPPPDLWERAHAAVLDAVANHTAVDTSVCLPGREYTEGQIIIDPDVTDMGEWELESVDLQVVPSPLNARGDAMQFAFRQGQNSAFYYFGGQDWSGYSVLAMDVQNLSPYFAELDVAVGDDDNYMLLTNTSQLIPPEGSITLEIPLVIPYGTGEVFNWAGVTYIELAVNTELTRRDYEGNTNTYETGGRTLIIDNIRIAR